MPVRQYANAPATTLSAPATATDATISVTAVTGLPITYPYTLIIDRGTSTEEAVEVTAASDLVLTVTRGIDATTAFAHANGATVAHGITARDVKEPNVHVNANSDVHGVTGSVVGTTDVQTLTNKTLTAPIVNGEVLGAWQNYTPSITNFEGTVDEARFCVIGNMCFIHVHITLTAVPTNTMVVGAFPHAAVNYSGGAEFYHPLGTAIAQDVGTGIHAGIARLNGTTSVIFKTNGFAEWSATTPYTWAIGDKLSFSIAYEIA